MMTLIWVNILLLTVCALFVLLALKLLLTRGWFTGFLRGLTGSLLIGLALILASSGLQFGQVLVQDASDHLATIQVKKLSAQTYRVRIDPVGAAESLEFTLFGDMLQIGAERLALPFSGVPPLFQLDHLKTRYYALEQQEKSRASRIDLKANALGFTAWDMTASLDPGVFLQSKITPFYAMREGEVLSLSSYNGDLLLKPVNQSL